MLMAAALAPYLAGWRRRYLAFFSYHLTDETFALHSSRAIDLKECKEEALSLNITAQFSWVMGTGFGVVASGLIGDVKPLGLDYALAAMFIGLLVGQCENKIRGLTAILSGAIATGLYLLGMAVVTYVPRLLPVLFLSGKNLHPLLAAWLRLIPPAVLAAMLVPSLLIRDNTVEVGFDNLFLWAAVIAFPVAIKFKSLSATVLVGMGLVAVGRYLGLGL